MTEDRFEQDLRSVVRNFAPAEVPLALRQRMIGVTAQASGRATLLGRGWVLAAGMILAVVVAVVVTAIVVPWVVRPAIPVAATPALGAKIQQTDGSFGYEMLRPEAWTAHDGRLAGRVYTDVSDAKSARFLLWVNNLEVMARNYASPDTLYPDWEAFRRASNLNGWTASLEQGWRHDGRPFTLVQTLPNARVYVIALPDGSRSALVAYVVDAGQPLVVSLGGGGDTSLEPLTQLQADGILADFITMVKSVRAIPADPTNVTPPLP